MGDGVQLFSNARELNIRDGKLRGDVVDVVMDELLLEPGNLFSEMQVMARGIVAEAFSLTFLV